MSDIRTSIRTNFNEVIASFRARFDRRLEDKFVDIISVIERNKTSTKRSPMSPKPVDTSQDDLPSVSLRLTCIETNNTPYCWLRTCYKLKSMSLTTTYCCV